MIMANNSNASSLTSTADVNNTATNVKKEPTVTATPTISQNTSGAATVNVTEVKVEVIAKPTGLPIMTNSDSRWIFSLEKIEHTPSRLEGVTKENELHERQEAALFINDLGIKLKVYVIFTPIFYPFNTVVKRLMNSHA